MAEYTSVVPAVNCDWHVETFWLLKMGPDILSRNIGTEVTLYAAIYVRSEQISALPYFNLKPSKIRPPSTVYLKAGTE
jgi:hypothetical protein